MRYLSLFSGIEAASCAWAPLGWSPVAFAEIDPFACAVLKHHYPDVPNLGDVCGITPAMLRDLGPVDVVIGGFPCQDLSVAGLRAGFGGVRSSLFFEMVRIVHELRPTVFVWENVPGLLSSNRGRDFAAVLMALDRIGLDGAWTSLDAQFFGLAQRRQRVFGVFARRDIGARRCAEILSLASRMSGHPAPRRATGEGAPYSTTPSLTASGRGVSRAGDSRGQDPLVPVLSGSRGFRSGEGGQRNDLDSHGAYIPMLSPALRAEGFDASEDGNGRAALIPVHARSENAHGQRMDGESETFVPVAYACQGTNVGEMGTLRQGNGHVTGGVPFVPVASFDERNITSAANRTRVEYGSPANTLHAEPLSVITPMAVRRLLPVECERLQGFPDGWTDVLYRGKSAADGNRYRAIGNSMAVPVIRWLGERIQAVLGDV
jgi:DNA (cytosine-5)-methyltransferase 1